MEFKKVFDQTVREFKREVNKVLKVPEIEQKVLDATSNEPWGPHGTLMADIAQATRNYNDYQMIMSIIWKRINDTGRNWRHVYKALTLLEFLVGHGSERVIDEVREHAYQLQTLADFQYIDSSGKDQGQNVRKKSQSLVTLVNDKERIREARQKAAENRDKYRSASYGGGMYKPSSYQSTGGSYGGRHDDDGYGSNPRRGNWDDDRYGRERDGDRYRDEDRYGRDGDRYGRDNDRSSRGDRYKDDYYKDYEHEEDKNRRGYDDRSNDKYRSYDKDRDRAYDDEDRYSSRSSRSRGDDYGADDRKAADNRMPAPPSYEDAVGSPDIRPSEEQSREGGGLAAAVARASRTSSIQANSLSTAPSLQSQNDDFDEFDPRASAAPATSAPTFQADQSLRQTEQVGAVRAPLQKTNMPSLSDELFGDSSGFTAAPVGPEQGVFDESPFKAEMSVPINAPVAFSVNTSMTVQDNGGVPGVGHSGNVSNAFASPPFMSAPSQPVPTAFVPAQPMAGAPSVSVQAVPMPTSNPSQPTSTLPMSNQAAPVTFGGDDLFGDSFSAVSNNAPATSSFSVPNSMQTNRNLVSPSFNSVNASQVNQNMAGITSQTLPSSVNQAQVPSSIPSVKQQQEKKFETKSTVWADTLSKGLIDLNIAGPKSNPLADIGIDFDLLRTERIKEERASSNKNSTVTMGKAMGSGSGLGLAGAGAIAPPAAPMMMANVGMSPGMGMTPPTGMGMRPPMGPGMGMMNPMMQMNPGMPFRPSGGMGMAMNPNMGMGMGMGAYPNQQQYGGYR
ncbi:hypothetical protein KP509_09G097000 [Ceratopteris richardii]|uniref:ENTH domain-containing protein n=1 Tax=Ceratopteris richardii TaxID=49495 RepID=A0A8T2U9D7_CERRI|nr:hypothetical protein KP509_09G097000 [Ceratopteris richardii]KAH7430393.1 hypothetical protein KP509_09G097000 [Ceratopteris richardii]KAH7430400.1 hypothetical protein KP509_09G097000 [Ceratopteris richardii]KAH7430406.1 hypothetical protein KP509_09G097000 [Ceratopteris richardii]KAH7430407.1 hypothetical protein KP509_09G097000 [Ceratopteris richardii]